MKRLVSERWGTHIKKYLLIRSNDINRPHQRICVIFFIHFVRVFIFSLSEAPKRKRISIKKTILQPRRRAFPFSWCVYLWTLHIPFADERFVEKISVVCVRLWIFPAAINKSHLCLIIRKINSHRINFWRNPVVEWITQFHDNALHTIYNGSIKINPCRLHRNQIKTF